MSGLYAKRTTVTAQKTAGDILTLLRGRGVTKTAMYEDERSAQIAFEMDGAAFRIALPLPDPNQKDFHYHSRGVRTQTESLRLYDAELNRRWRALFMVIKAKIVAVEEGISTMQAEFVGNVVLGDGRTVSETYAPQLGQLSALGQIKALELPGGST